MYPGFYLPIATALSTGAMSALRAVFCLIHPMEFSMTTIFLEDTFDSAHWQPNVPPGHKCAELHGHTYKIRIEVTGEVDAVTGWVVDFAVIKDAWSKLKATLDHHCLNKIAGLENATCENLLEYVWGRLELPGLSGVEIRETEHCGASRRAA